MKDSQSGMWVMKRSFISQIRLHSDDMSLSEEIKIIAFRFFRSAESDGRYYARAGTAKLKVIQDGWKNFKYSISIQTETRISSCKVVYKHQ